MKPSKWPEQEPASGETRFEFALRMALQRRSNDETLHDTALRERYRRHGYKLPVGY